MPTASELLRHGRRDELWQMCCGFLDLDANQFMEIQERLLLNQLELLNKCALGKKLFNGKSPKTLEEFRKMVPLTTYKDYGTVLSEKQEENLPAKPVMWARSSGRSGDYACKWMPFTQEYIENLSIALYGVGIFSCAQYKGDTSKMPDKAKLLYAVAPKPYTSGTFADILQLQTPLEYMPSLEKAEKMTFEERISTGFQEALNEGLDYFFGMSLALVKVGEKLTENSEKINIKPYIKQPRALWRLLKGVIKSKLARRTLMPKDIWETKGIIGSGIDSWVYKEKIKQLWGKSPLDLYSCTEGGVIATQTWDFGSMTFFPNINFLEFITEEEQTKNLMDRTYQPQTLLLNELEAGEEYEIVVTNFHGGALVRYRIGDIVKITSLANDSLGIKTPQMTFERRSDGIIDLAIIRLTEKTLWQALEASGVKYQDWIAYKVPGTQVLDLYIEPMPGYEVKKNELESFIYDRIMKNNDIHVEDMYNFSVKIHFLESGFFSDYSLQKQKEGADLAHIKPPHINPRGEILSRILGEAEETIVVKKTKVKTSVVETQEMPEKDKITL